MDEFILFVLKILFLIMVILSPTFVFYEFNLIVVLMNCYYPLM
jgi:hypothetical protein